MATKAKIRYVFPATELLWVNIINPDSKFDPANPKFQVSMKYDAATGRKVIAELEDKVPQFKGKIKVKRDNDDNFIFKAVQRQKITWAGGSKVATFTPVVLMKDGDGAIKYEGSEPWSGSIGEVAVVLEEAKTATGTTLAIRLNGVRLHEVKTGGDGGSNGGDPLFGPTSTMTEGGVAEEEEHPFEDDEPAFN